MGVENIRTSGVGERAETNSSQIHDLRWPLMVTFCIGACDAAALWPSGEFGGRLEPVPAENPMLVPWWRSHTALLTVRTWQDEKDCSRRDFQTWRQN